MDKRRPDALRVPDPLHVGTRLRFAHAKHVAAIAVKESGHPVVRDAMDVNRDFFQLLHNGAELVEVIIRRVLKIDRNMDVSHAETADARRLVGQGLLVRVQPQVHNMAHAKGVNVRKLLFGRLTGRRDPVVKSSPVVDRLRVGHQTPLTAETRAEDDPRPGSVASSGFQKAKLPERRDAIVETDLFCDLATLDTEYACPGESHFATGRRRSEPMRKSLNAGPVCVPPPSHRPTT